MIIFVVEAVIRTVVDRILPEPCAMTKLVGVVGSDNADSAVELSDLVHVPDQITGLLSH